MTWQSKKELALAVALALKRFPEGTETGDARAAAEKDYAEALKALGTRTADAALIAMAAEAFMNLSPWDYYNVGRPLLLMPPCAMMPCAMLPCAVMPCAKLRCAALPCDYRVSAEQLSYHCGCLTSFNGSEPWCAMVMCPFLCSCFFVISLRMISRRMHFLAVSDRHQSSFAQTDCFAGGMNFCEHTIKSQAESISLRGKNCL